MEDFFFIRHEGEFEILYFSAILYIESLKNYIRIVTLKQSYIVLVTLKHAEEVLPRNQFCRIHRRYIIALKNIKNFSNERVCIHDKYLPISEPYRKGLFDHVIILMGEARNKLKSSSQDDNPDLNGLESKEINEVS
ncbi:MAG: LytTR family transcriptional regulator [Bacteroidetes bacterium]|nr:LytTR family transcriptional regulator [Bacteroidota bacterium]